MTEFVFHNRFDADQADEGVWVPVIDENDNLWGEFRLCLFEKTTPRYRATMERLQRKYPAKNGKQNAKLRAKSDDEWAIELFVEMSLVDWKLKDAKGKDIPFSKATATEYLNHPSAAYVAGELGTFARDVRNFQPEEQTELPEKN